MTRSERGVDRAYGAHFYPRAGEKTGARTMQRSLANSEVVGRVVKKTLGLVCGLALIATGLWFAYYAGIAEGYNMGYESGKKFSGLDADWGAAALQAARAKRSLNELLESLEKIEPQVHTIRFVDPPSKPEMDRFVSTTTR